MSIVLVIGAQEVLFDGLLEVGWKIKAQYPQATFRQPTRQDAKLLPVVSLQLSGLVSRRCSPLYEEPQDIEIARNVVDWGATPRFTSPEESACVLAKVFPGKRWYAERKRELVSFILRDCCRNGANVEEAVRTYLDVSYQLGGL
jgi:hypothetical protein